MEKHNVGIALNILLIILEIIALIQCQNAFGSLDLRYYTIDSNIFALISAILYVYTRKKIPKAVQLAKYSSTLSLLITFLVVIFVLYPMYDFNFQLMFLDGSNLLMHIVCPLIALISFIFFEEIDLDNSFRNNVGSLYFTIVYAIILISLNILRVLVGPYPFLEVYNQPVFMSVLWITGIMIAAFILSRLLMMLKKLNQKRFA